MFIIQYKRFFENLITTSHHDSVLSGDKDLFNSLTHPNNDPIDKENDAEWDTIDRNERNNRQQQSECVVPTHSERNLWVILFYYCWYYELSLGSLFAIKQNDKREEDWSTDGLKLRMQHVWVASFFFIVIMLIAAVGYFEAWDLFASKFTRRRQ